MGFVKEEKGFRRLWGRIPVPRWLKTLVFFITMFVSLMLFSTPLLFIIADAVLPSAVLSIYVSPDSFSSLLRNYDFRYSLVDIPVVSIFRAFVILCAYSSYNGTKLSSGVYLIVSIVCTVISLVFLSFKAYVIMIVSGGDKKLGVDVAGRAMEAALLISFVGFGIGHAVAAYRTSCKEKRKLMVFKIDIEAVSACQKGFLDAQRFSKKLEQTKE